ncbi:MAG: helix-turn-helix transcriptional regulator [Clostridia bacterium]|nr:helix-turn-helix transcriptional regulator [Clostridia bacterium]
MYGKRLQRARKNAKFSLEKVAEIMNTTHATISRYENEKRKPDPETLAALCKLYKVSANYILGLTKDLPHPEEDEN